MLLETVDGRVTQGFGPSVLRVEPGMYSTGDKAYWLPYFGASYFDDFHPGIDRSAEYGTEIRAMEAGTVVFADYKDDISGRQVEVEIRPNTRFSVNHLSTIHCQVGDRVPKGSLIGRVGTSGATTGPHTHEGVSIREADSNGIYRTFCYNPALFTKGGRLANDPRIQPLEQKLVVDGGGVTIWFAGSGFDDRGDVWGYSRKRVADRPAGIYRHGERKAALTYQFTYITERWTEEFGVMVIVTGFNRKLAMQKDRVRFL